ncbi:Lipocalin domain-containing protein [Caenorhabditis elegans]|uniref:LiPocalin-Related protein n=1 Tax=Caenorhabditis elegans TaxID=6239 RepID=G5EEA2_CAEEL|nr:LiPocalin-Related protein [Caenorhabditis elegans]CAA92030.1 LiPocalin-Related protein [Caenorhabditis elegans]|eukprot:NP_509849.1 LiPocalin-Related protein [Caenorhabditis elegans]
MRSLIWILATTLAVALGAISEADVPVVIHLPAQHHRPRFLGQVVPPRAVNAAPRAPAPTIAQEKAIAVPQPQQPIALPPAPPAAQQPVLPVTNGDQSFAPRVGAAIPPPPPVNIPTDVQNQLIKFFGLDSFGIPGLTGNHPEGFAGAVQEMRAAGIPVPGIPAEQVNPEAAGVKTVTDDVLAQANPNFQDQLSQIQNAVNNPGPYKGGANVPLPAEQPGENGLIGLLSNSIRKVIKETGVSDALSNSLPNLLGSGSGADSSSAPAASSNIRRAPQAAASFDDAVATVSASAASSSNIRRQPSAAQRALSGFAAALGGGGNNSPTHAGLPRIPGIPLLPGGIPRNSQGQIDIVSLIGSVTKRVSNGTTLSELLPPERLQTLADNVTDALLPETPTVDLSKFMGRWFEGINSPRATEQRCVVHHYGGLTRNDKTATFTALKVYREGSEFGPVKYSLGYAFRGGNKDAMLQLHSSETSDAQPFWIYKLGPEGKNSFGDSQYEYAIISNWVKYPVTVLVRDPDTFKTKYQKEVLRWLEDQGFINGFIRAFNLLQPAGYSTCQYADSTFEVFGK